VRLGTSRRKLLEVVRLTTISLSFFGVVAAQESIPAGKSRAILGGEAVLTDEGYAAYRKCVAAIPLGHDMETYYTALDKCKNNSKQDAYALPKNERLNPTTERKGLQEQELKRMR
jgi:hypothetical protein